MRDLAAANRLIERIAAAIPNITPLSENDYSLFREFFGREPHTYGNSWTYITQGMYGIGPNKLGYKYYDGKNLSAVCLYPKTDNSEIIAFYWIRPMGINITEKIVDISKKLLSNFKTPVYAKKLFKNQYDLLTNKGFQDVSEYPWFSSSPAEDDTHPEQILDISHTINFAKKLGKNRQLNRALRYFEYYKDDKNIHTDNIQNHIKSCYKLLDDFFTYKKMQSRCKVISDPIDYYAMIQHPAPEANSVVKVILKGNNVIGFYFVEIHDAQSASQYALISLRNKYNHLSDYLMFDMLFTLQNRKCTYVNLGGSECPDLNDFKIKYHPIKENKMYWAVLY